ncbi:hypothetical protein PIB30_073380 [Stylosanthes scabra]|uniref:Secreted protein n=1 Tax=Stylosanthes scabra TaxID=79078 RepID=A0ABU6UPZ6_9FABA|nr:hypothetical protein [Stylosanthes scabra]
MDLEKLGRCFCFPRICLLFCAYAWVLEQDSMMGSRLSLLNVSLKHDKSAFRAYAWIFYAYVWMNEARRVQSHVWACRNVKQERELLAFHAYAWTCTPMRGKGEPKCHA